MRCPYPSQSGRVIVADSLLVQTLDRARCIALMPELIGVSADVSDWREDEFLAELPDKWNLSFTVTIDRIVGYAVLSRKWPDRVHIHQFMVAPRWRSSGIGAAMVAAARDRAETTPLSLKVSRTNARAISFYDRNGFGIDPSNAGEYLWMVRKP